MHQQYQIQSKKLTNNLSEKEQNIIWLFLYSGIKSKKKQKKRGWLFLMGAEGEKYRGKQKC